MRAQRVLNVDRVPGITRYILDNEEGYLFSSITASFNCPLTFTPSPSDDRIGSLEMDLENMEFVINDGQHRAAAIAAALKENPDLGKERISVLLFEMENLDRLQQMFSDLNRFAHKTSRSMDILYDHRDNLSALTKEVSESVLGLPRDGRQGEDLGAPPLAEAAHAVGALRRERRAVGRCDRRGHRIRRSSSRS